ncbi:MAG TPA: response regulator [Nitrososphaeraceae archaeon]|nr:response regulator [Nitrososphaeraceae archaeon]
MICNTTINQSGTYISSGSSIAGGGGSSSTQTITNRKKEDPSSYTILIVDDEPDITLFYKSALEEQAGFKVDVFNDPLDALSKLKEIYSYSLNISRPTKKPYDLMLLDIKMPKMNGFELYREINKIVKKSQKEEGIKICFITAYEVYYEQLKQEFPKIGNDVGCFIKKPINASDLIRRVKQELLLE